VVIKCSNVSNQLTALIFNEKFWVTLGMIIYDEFSEQQSPSWCLQQNTCLLLCLLWIKCAQFSINLFNF